MTRSTGASACAGDWAQPGPRHPPAACGSSASRRTAGHRPQGQAQLPGTRRNGGPFVIPKRTVSMPSNTPPGHRLHQANGPRRSATALRPNVRCAHDLHTGTIFGGWRQHRAAELPYLRVPLHPGRRSPPRHQLRLSMAFTCRRCATSIRPPRSPSSHRSVSTPTERRGGTVAKLSAPTQSPSRLRRGRPVSTGRVPTVCAARPISIRPTSPIRRAQVANAELSPRLMDRVCINAAA